MQSGPMQPPLGSLHVWRYYGYRTQNWIHRLLCGMQRYRPHILTRTGWLDEERLREFPWPADRLHLFPKLPIPARVGSKILPVLRTRWRHVLGTRDTAHVRSLCEQHRCPVVHVHFGWLGVSFLDAARRLPGPLVVSLYGRDLFGASGRYRQALTKLFSRENVHVHVTSEAMVPAAMELGAQPERLAAIHVGIGREAMPAPDAVRSKLQARASASRLKIVTVGRLIEVKAPHRLPSVAAGLRREGIDFEWVVVGDGPLRGQLEENCRRFDVADRFRIMGELPHRDIRPLLEDCDLMVFNSVLTPGGDVMESLGVSLMEGGACGLPIVSCRVGGIPEVVADGETGFLVESGDLEAMAGRIRQLALDGDLRMRMGIAAAEGIRSRFDSARLAEQMELFYDRILAENPRAKVAR